MIAGFDCGLGGAIALLDRATGQLAGIVDMPVLIVRKGRRSVDVHALTAWLRENRPGHTIIEAAQAIPKQSAWNTGQFFLSFGIVIGVVGTLEVPYTIVQPAQWKRNLGVPAAKDAARARASQLIPTGAGYWTRRKDDGRAEAALLALYGARQLNNLANNTLTVPALATASTA
jgi:crossover junction endodeoxyribonuclease RuvC